MSRSLDQEAAAFAWARVEKNANEEYRRAAKGAPALIMANGLMQTVAFYKAKKKDAILGDILGWLGKRMGSEPPKGAAGDAMGNAPDFRLAMRFLQNADSDQYMRATEEAQAILKWIRQFADALRKEG